MTVAKKTAIWSLYILLAGTILLYVLFPSDAVKEHLTQRINLNFRDFQVDIGSLRPVFPPAISLGNVLIKSDGQIIFSVDRVKLKPQLHSMLFSKKVLYFRADSCGGEISGSLSSIATRERTEISASGSFSQMRIEKIPAAYTKFGDRLTGTLSGDFHVNTTSQQPETFSGQVTVSDFSYEPPVSFMNLDRFDFQQIDAELDFDGEYLEILNADMQGPEMTGTASGDIFLESPIFGSRIDLDFTINPLLSSPLSEINTLVLKVGGTFERPEINIVSAR